MFLLRNVRILFVSKTALLYACSVYKLVFVSMFQNFERLFYTQCLLTKAMLPQFVFSMYGEVLKSLNMFYISFFCSMKSNAFKKCH